MQYPHWHKVSCMHIMMILQYMQIHTIHAHTCNTCTYIHIAHSDIPRVLDIVTCWTSHSRYFYGIRTNMQYMQMHKIHAYTCNTRRYMHVAHSDIPGHRNTLWMSLCLGIFWDTYTFNPYFLTRLHIVADRFTEVRMITWLLLAGDGDLQLLLFVCSLTKLSSNVSQFRLPIFSEIVKICKTNFQSMGFLYLSNFI